MRVLLDYQANKVMQWQCQAWKFLLVALRDALEDKLTAFPLSVLNSPSLLCVDSKNSIRATDLVHLTLELNANDAPAAVDNHATADRSQHIPNREVEGEPNGKSPGESRWKNELATYQDLFSKHKFPFNRCPATPERVSQRYRQRRLRQTSMLLFNEYKFRSSLPNGWNRHIHPEGNVLFYHQEMRIWTESNICDSETRKKLLFVATALVQMAIEKQDSILLDEFTELVISINDQNWCYYFVDHSSHLLFWVDRITMNQLGNSLQGVTEHSHIKYLVESLYWYAFPRNSRIMRVTSIQGCTVNTSPTPTGHTLPEGIVEDLRGMLNHAKTDMMTGHSPSSPFGKDELVAISDLVNSLKGDKMNNPYSVWVVARLMSYFTDNQFVNFCGQPTVRLNADTPLFEPPTWDRRVLFQVINVFLFGSPNEHSQRLHRVWVDSMIIQPRWKEFVDRLTTEWGRYTIFSTVMLAVDFSFLAVPGVVNSGHNTTAIQVIIYCSIVATVASIVFSFTLLNAYSNPGLTRAVPAGKAMHVLSRIRSGMACLAITHSLPMASLIWSYVTSALVVMTMTSLLNGCRIALFSTALAIQLFGPKERGTVVTLGVECFIIVLLVTMCFSVTGMLYGMDGSEGDSTDSSTEKTLVLGEPDV
ncbi:hypothetical protein JVU11DRAFT_5262 [Chiua virens]|nr:hypothetical protein JVU11DRAFT_5262 [Chiua virens]